MNDSKILEIKVGITILSGVILLVLGIVWLKGITFKPNTFEASILFQNTAGLQIGDPVTVSGLRVGKVTDINLTGDSVLVAISINNSVQLRSDVQAVISSIDFFGGKKLEIVPGKSEESFNTKNRIIGSREPDLTELTSQLKEIANDVKGTLEKVDSVLVGINGVVGDKSFTSALKRAAFNLDSTTARIKTMVYKSDSKIDSLLTRLSSASRGFRTLVEKTDGRIDTALVNVNGITRTLGHITLTLDSMMNKIQNGEGNLGKMIHDDALYNKLDHTVAQLDSLVAAVRDKGMKVNLKLFGD
ncbi:MlaD family protein [bacterium]|nr:MlaD family protein [bacterium]